MKLDPIAKAAIADLAERIRQLSDAVDKLEVADKQFRELANLDRAVHTNGHLRKHTEARDDDGL